MRHIKTFDTFLYEMYYHSNNKINFQREVCLALVSSNVLLENEKLVVQDSLNEGYYGMFFADAINEETLVNKWKAKYDKATELLKSKGKEALGKAQEVVLKIGQNIGGILKTILNSVQKVLNAAYEKFKTGAAKVVNDMQDAILKAATLKAEDEDSGQDASTEITNGLAMSKAGLSFVKGGFTKKLASAEKEAVTTDESFNFLGMYESMYSRAIIQHIKENGFTRDELLTLNEEEDEETAIPFFGALMNKLRNYPPFSVFNKIEDKAKEFGAYLIEKISYYIHKLGDGPGPFKFPWMGGQLAKLVLDEIMDFSPRALLKKGLDLLVATTVPMLSVVFTICKWCLLAFEWVGVAVMGFEKATEKLGDKAPKWMKSVSKEFEETREESKKKTGDNNKNESNMKHVKLYEDFLNEIASTTLDLSDKDVALSIKNKLPAKYKKDINTLVYSAPYALVSHGAKLMGIPTPSRIYHLEKMNETYKGSDNWVSLSALAIIQDTTNQVSFVIVYEEFDPIQLDELKSNKDLYKEESYTDEKDLLKKMQNWFAYSEKIFKQVIEDKS